MKVLSLSLMTILLSACASHHRDPASVAEFKKENVCSDEAVAYAEKNAPLKKGKSSDPDVQAKMASIEPAVRKCYDEEMKRRNRDIAFNICLVAGYNDKGENEFFDFYSKEQEMTKMFKGCLNSIRKDKQLEGLKDVVIVQPFAVSKSSE